MPFWFWPGLGVADRRPVRRPLSEIPGDRGRVRGGAGTDARWAGQGPVSNAGASRPLRHFVSGAAGFSKKETVISWAHFEVANTTWGS